MRLLAVTIISIVILLMGFSAVVKERSISRSMEEAIRFINFYDTQLNYRRPQIDEVCTQCKKMDFRYISFEGGISPRGEWCSEAEGLFQEFICQIGTTDFYGQTTLCREYLARFGDMLAERKRSENSKIKVNAAVSILGAVGVFVAFI